MHFKCVMVYGPWCRQGMRGSRTIGLEEAHPDAQRRHRQQLWVAHDQRLDALRAGLQGQQLLHDLRRMLPHDVRRFCCPRCQVGVRRKERVQVILGDAYAVKAGSTGLHSQGSPES